MMMIYGFNIFIENNATLSRAKLAIPLIPLLLLKPLDSVKRLSIPKVEVYLCTNMVTKSTKVVTTTYKTGNLLYKNGNSYVQIW